MIPIRYLVGDATAPKGPGLKIICHVCNDVGAWGSGFVLALSHRDFIPEAMYREWSKTTGNHLPFELDDNPFILGNIQFCTFTDRDVFVCNMIAQSGVASTTNSIPLSYPALRHCLRKLAVKAHMIRASIHMPRIGCGLAGGDWKEVSKIIMQEVSAQNIEVIVYDLPPSSPLGSDIDAGCAIVPRSKFDFGGFDNNKISKDFPEIGDAIYE